VKLLGAEGMNTATRIMYEQWVDVCLKESSRFADGMMVKIIKENDMSSGTCVCGGCGPRSTPEDSEYLAPPKIDDDKLRINNEMLRNYVHKLREELNFMQVENRELREHVDLDRKARDEIANKLNLTRETMHEYGRNITTLQNERGQWGSKNRVLSDTVVRLERELENFRLAHDRGDLHARCREEVVRLTEFNRKLQSDRDRAYSEIARNRDNNKRLVDLEAERRRLQSAITMRDETLRQYERMRTALSEVGLLNLQVDPSLGGPKPPGCVG